MKIAPSIRFASLAVALALFTSCSATNKLTSSWSDPVATTTPHKKIVVVAATPNAALRRTFEDTFSGELRARGIDAVASYTFGGQGQLDKDQAVAKLKEVGADGVFVTRLVDKQNYETYYPPTYTTMAAPSQSIVLTESSVPTPFWRLSVP